MNRETDEIYKKTTIDGNGNRIEVSLPSINITTKIPKYDLRSAVFFFVSGLLVCKILVDLWYQN